MTNDRKSISLCTVHTEYPTFRSKGVQIDIRREGLDSDQIFDWYHVKSIQQYRGDGQRKMKLELYQNQQDNENNNNLNNPKPDNLNPKLPKLFTVFWNCKERVNVRLHSEPSDTIHVSTIATELYEMDVCTDTDEEDTRSIHVVVDTQLATRQSPRQILEAENDNLQHQFTLLILQRFGYDNIIWNIDKELHRVVCSADIPNIAELLYTFATVAPCFLLPSELYIEPWLLPESTKIATTTRRIWTDISHEEVVKWMKKIVIAMVHVFLVQTKEYAEKATATQMNIENTFSFDGELIMHSFRVRMEHAAQESKDVKEPPFHLRPWSKSTSLSFPNGEMQMTDQTIQWIPYDHHETETKECPTSIVQLSRTLYSPSCRDNEQVEFWRWWQASFLDDENATFAIRVLASCLFRKEHRYQPDHRKVVIIFEQCSSSFASHVCRVLEELFEAYLLWPEATKMPLAMHTYYRFALTNLCRDDHPSSTVDPRQNRYDVASNLGASIPHIIFCPRSAMQDINFSGHAPPYIFNLYKSLNMTAKIDNVIVMPATFTKSMLQRLVQVWQTVKRMDGLGIDLKPIPSNIQMQQSNIVQIVATAIRFMNDQIIYNNYDISADRGADRNHDGQKLTFNEIRKTFSIHLNKLLERNELQRHLTEKLPLYVEVIIDHLLRSVHNLRDPWYNVHFRKENENKPIYHRSIGDPSSKIFEKMYQSHKEETSLNNKPIKSRTQFYFWCKDQTRQKS